MDPGDKVKITQNLSVLSAKTDWSDKLEASLLEHKVFGKTLLDSIKLKPEKDRSYQLFLDVQKRGPRAYGGLIKALVESGNQEAARVLDPSIATTLSGSRNRKVWNEPTYEQPEEEEGVCLRDDRTPVEVNVTKSLHWKGPPQYKAYPMRSTPRGMVLIIDNEEFDNDIMPKREGSHLDANNLDILFEQLGFKTIVRRNLSYGQMNRELSNFAQLSSHAESDMCVVCILSHGNSGLIFSTDGREVSTEWVLRRFNNDGCPALKGKPKFFILQACRGDEPDYGYVPRLDSPDDGGVTATDAQGVAAPRKRSQPIKDPTWEDMLIAYATVPGYVANRNLYRGTWFIESICEVFMSMAHDTDIREMLDEVSDRMRYYESEMGTKQSCSYEVRHFYKKLFFNPGVEAPKDWQPPREGQLKKVGGVASNYGLAGSLNATGLKYVQES